MPDPFIKWAKRNTHSDPPLFPWGLKRLTRPLLSLLPPTRKGVKKSIFFHALDLGFLHFTSENVKHHTLSIQVFSCSSQRL